uniref:(northern house mosquito) hypothetical protein n=1 Tax=Culex pipiens TaxID=7175 RepID=A0A8D8A0E6_CULPI
MFLFCFSFHDIVSSCVSVWLFAFFFTFVIPLSCCFVFLKLLFSVKVVLLSVAVCFLFVLHLLISNGFVFLDNVYMSMMWISLIFELFCFYYESRLVSYRVFLKIDTTSVCFSLYFLFCFD